MRIYGYVRVSSTDQKEDRQGAFESGKLPCAFRQQVPTQYGALQADDDQVRGGVSLCQR